MSTVDRASLAPSHCSTMGLQGLPALAHRLAAVVLSSLGSVAEHARQEGREFGLVLDLLHFYFRAAGGRSGRNRGQLEEEVAASAVQCVSAVLDEAVKLGYSSIKVRRAGPAQCTDSKRRSSPRHSWRRAWGAGGHAGGSSR